jgi:antirestriction protein
MNQSTDSNSETRKIEAYEISHHARMGALPRHFGRYMMTFEGFVYDLMRQFSPEYTGGNWRFMEVSTGSFFMTPPNRTYRIAVPSNGYQGEMSADAAGITVCLFAKKCCCRSFYQKSPYRQDSLRLTFGPQCGP